MSKFAFDREALSMQMRISKTPKYKHKGRLYKALAKKKLVKGGKNLSTSFFRSDTIHDADSPAILGVAEMLGCRVADLGVFYERADFFLDESRVQDLYDNLTENHVLSVVSSDGFLEAEETETGRDIYQIMLDLLRRGVHVRYFYPPHGTSSGGGRTRSSARDFETVRKRFAQDLGDRWYKPANALTVHPTAQEPNRQKPSPIPSGYLVSARALDLFGRPTRHVIVTRYSPESGTEQVEWALLYAIAQSAAVAVGREQASPRRVWLRMPDDASKAYYRDIACNAEPIDGLGVEQPNRFDGPLQKGYRKGMGEGEAYEKLRDLVRTETAVFEAVQEVLEVWWGREGLESVLGKDRAYRRALRYLDVGSEDGVVAERMVGELGKLVSSRSSVQTTLLEPAVPPWVEKEHPERFRSFVEDTLEEFQGRPESYDVITFFHATYLLDPRQLLRAFEFLAPDGLLIVVAAPHEQDIFNAITTCVDIDIFGSDRINSLNGEHVSGRNSKRMFAEDVHKSLSIYFGNSVNCIELKNWIRLDNFVSERDGISLPTELALNTAGMFMHQRRKSPSLSPDEKVLLAKAIESRSEEVQSDSETAFRHKVVPNDAWIMSIRKRQVLSSLRPVVFGLNYNC